MPARVHALLVVRPDGRVAADIHLQRTLTALRAQSRPVDALTIVLCDPDAAVKAVAATSGAEAVISAGRRTSFAQALAIGSHRLDGDAVWVLAHDTIPDADALAALTAALETAPSVAFAAPKLVRADESDRIVSFGVSMTRLGRTVGLADGEHDQGQHDGTEDVLGSDVRGILVRADAWRDLHGIDPALAGADEGLDLGVRARLHGGRIVLAAAAIVAIAGRSPSPLSAAYAQRTAQLHRRLVYAPALAVPLHWLSLLPLALLRSLGALLGKHPVQILPEWGAAATAMVRPVAVSRARRGIRTGRAASWAQIAPLRVTSRQLRHRLDDDVTVGSVRTDLHFFSGGGAWVVLAALVVSVIAFLSLLAWPVLGGGALAPLRATLVGLWSDAAYGLRPLGWDTSGAADPFSAVVALLGSLWPAAPSRVLVVLWVLALPLAALGGWFAAARFSERGVVRAAVAVAWALAPSLLSALVEGRPTVVIAHLVLPWLLWTASVAHRSWSSAGLASILAAVVLACAPALGAAFALLWVLALLLTAIVRRGRALARIVWLAIPTVVVFVPLAWQRVNDGSPWALLADPGVPLGDGGGTDLGRRLLLALGFPASDGWAGFTGADIGGWTPLLVAPLLLLALAAPIAAAFSGRTIPSVLLAVTALTGIGTALVVIGIAVTVDADSVVSVWPGTALSLYWLALACAAALSLDALPGRVALRAPLAVVVMAVLGVSAVPALTAPLRGASALTDGPSSTLPAYVEAEGRDGLATATFVMTPADDGAVITDVVWGETASLGGQTTLRSAADGTDAGDDTTAQLAAALITTPDGTAVSDLAAHGVAFVLLAGEAGPDGSIVETEAARALRLQAENSLDQRNDLEIVGDTAKGKLWRITTEVAERVEGGSAAWSVALLQGGVVLAALLLALPTRRSLAEGRRRSRLVGLPRARRRAMVAVSPAAGSALEVTGPADGAASAAEARAEGTDRVEGTDGTGRPDDRGRPDPDRTDEGGDA